MPHDAVEQVRTSPVFSRDRTVFAIVRTSLLRSTDAGDRWTRLTRGLGAERPVALQISPGYADDRMVFVATSGDGVFRSRDGGDTWLSANGGLENLDVRLLALSPSFPADRALIAVDSGGRLYRSRDAGSQWLPIAIGDAVVTAASWQRQLVVGTTEGRILASTDGGNSWRPLRSTGVQGPITALETTPSGALLAGTEEGGLIVAAAGGPRSAALEGRRITALARLPDADGTLAAATWNQAVFVSRDSGASWHLRSDGLAKHPQADQYRQPHFTSLAAADDGTLFLGSFTGLYRSGDLGATWLKLGTLTVRHAVALDVTDAGGAPLVAVSSYGAGAYFLDPERRSWRIGNRGLVNPRLGAIVFSPDFDSDGTLFAATYGNVYRSHDRGASWRAVSIRPLLGKGLVEPIGIALSPHFASDRTLWVACYPFGLLRSTDGGESFALLWDSERKPARGVAVAAGDGAGLTLFVTRPDGLFRSRDAGASFERVAEEVPLVRPVLVLSPDFARDRTLYVGAEAGLFRSRDGGTTWRPVPLPEAGRPVVDLAISPDYRRDRRIAVQIGGGGFYVGRDRGRGFAAVAAGPTLDRHEFSHLIRRESASRIAFSPGFRRDRTIWAISGEELLRSADRGRSWRIVPRPVRYEAEAAQAPWLWVPVQLEGAWSRQQGEELSGTQQIASDRPGAAAVLDFVGTGVRWIGEAGPGLGRARVELDGQPVATVDQRRPTLGHLQVLFSRGGLAPGRHRLRVVVEEGRVTVDAFEVDRDG